MTRFRPIVELSSREDEFWESIDDDEFLDEEDDEEEDEFFADDDDDEDWMDDI